MNRLRDELRQVKEELNKERANTSSKGSSEAHTLQKKVGIVDYIV